MYIYARKCILDILLVNYEGRGRSSGTENVGRLRTAMSARANRGC